MPFALIVALALAALSAIFAIQNAEPVTISFFGWQWEASLALVLILTLASGALIGYLAGLPTSLARGAESRKQRKRIDDLEARVQRESDQVEAAGDEIVAAIDDLDTDARL